MFRFVALRSHALGLSACALTGMTFFLSGCGRNTADKALQQAYLDNPTIHKASIAPFEGTVTVDGGPPGKDGTVLMVILNDPKNPQDPHQHPKLITGCDSDGHFDFTTFEPHDGVQCGSYIITFVQLKDLTAPFGKNRKPHYGPPDELKNLYNDPDKNADVKEFHIDIQPPGVKDAHFDLLVAGKAAVEQPGPHAITAIDSR